MNKKIILTIAGLSLALAGAFAGVNKVYADETTKDLPPMIQRMTERFGLNQREVKTFMDEERETHRAERRQGIEERLNQAINEGSLTEDQKNTILTKIGEMCDGAGNHGGELRDWAEENNINLRELSLKRFGEGKGPRMGKYSTN